MSHLVGALLTLILLIGIGCALGHIKFLGRDFLADLNKLVFWVALPSLILRSLARAEISAHETWRVIASLLGATLLTLAAAWLLVRLFRVETASRGTLLQNAFRGNLAYIGLPTITYSLEGLPKEVVHDTMSTALIGLASLTALFNVLAVFCLLPRDHSSPLDGWKLIGKSISRNPIIIACVLGLLIAWLQIPIPRFVDHTLESLGSAAVPIALLCIGGSFAMVSLNGKVLAIALGMVGKLAVAPICAWFLARSLGLEGLDLRIVMIYAACPTAAAAYIMAKQMDGDEALASATIAATTIFCFIPLAWILLAT